MNVGDFNYYVSMCSRLGKYQLDAKTYKHSGAEPVQGLVCLTASGEELAEGPCCHTYSTKYDNDEDYEDYPKNSDLDKWAPSFLRNKLG